MNAQARVLLDAARQAQRNARERRRMAKEWPRHAEQDLAEATKRYRIGLGYLQTARQISRQEVSQ